MLKATHIGSDQPPKIGVNWATKWLRSHSEFKLLLQKPIEENCHKALTRETAESFFRSYKNVIKKYNIKRRNIWNMDETGLRIGVGRGQWVVVPADELYNTRFT
jgi:transposase-like protein